MNQKFSSKNGQETVNDNNLHRLKNGISIYVVELYPTVVFFN